MFQFKSQELLSHEKHRVHTICTRFCKNSRKNCTPFQMSMLFIWPIVHICSLLFASLHSHGLAHLYTRTQRCHSEHKSNCTLLAKLTFCGFFYKIAYKSCERSSWDATKTNKLSSIALIRVSLCVICLSVVRIKSFNIR